MPNSRLTKTHLLSSAALAGPILAANVRISSIAAYPGGVRITKSLHGGALAMPGQSRVTYVSLIRAQSIHRAFYLQRLPSSSTITDFIPDGPGSGGPGGEGPGHGWGVDLVAGTIPEFNPYKPQVPESLIALGGDQDGAGREIFDWLEEQQKTIRLQHNITQAGDSTFPYQMIINAHSEQQFTLGSVGKFYHETYGMIHGRYVKYEKMNPSLTPTAPVGLIKNTGILDWIVTNRLEISDPHLVVGIQASYVMPTDGQYGWVIVDGVNLQSIVTEGDNIDIGVPYVWSASGKISPTGNGVVVCRRTRQGGDVTLLRGIAYVRIEGALVDTDAIAQLIADVAQLQEDLAILQDASDLDDALKAINTKLKTLQQQLTAETNQRKAADQAINSRIDNLSYVTAAQLNTAITNLRNEILALLDQLNAKIDQTNAIALEALNKANQALAINIDSIQTQIEMILNWISSESLRPKGKFPVVDGSIPPNLMYNEDGSLIYVETF